MGMSAGGGEQDAHLKRPPMIIIPSPLPLFLLHHHLHRLLLLLHLLVPLLLFPSSLLYDM
jgi:hypothetical protein